MNSDIVKRPAAEPVARTLDKATTANSQQVVADAKTPNPEPSKNPKDTSKDHSKHTEQRPTSEPVSSPKPSKAKGPGIAIAFATIMCLVLVGLVIYMQTTSS